MNQLPGTLQPHKKRLWSPLMFWNGKAKSLLVGNKSASDDAPDGWLPEIQLVLIFWHVLVFKKKKKNENASHITETSRWILGRKKNTPGHT